jgi:hypothetical protein
MRFVAKFIPISFNIWHQSQVRSTLIRTLLLVF